MDSAVVRSQHRFWVDDNDWAGLWSGVPASVDRERRPAWVQVGDRSTCT